MKRCSILKRTAVLFLSACLAFALLPGQVRADHEGYASDTPATEACYYTLEQAYRYLDDFYLQQHPEAALETMFGSVSDNTKLQNLADAISYGYETDREKADAVYDWLDRNLTSNEFGSPFPIDAFFDREGNCATYAYLMQDLLRKMGIPAVYSTGWSLPMNDMTFGEVVEQNDAGFYTYAGHAWCFAYIDGEWVLYDVPYHTKGIHDPEVLSGKYYIASVAHVMPAYDYPNLMPTNKYVVYDGEKHFAVDHTGAVVDGGGVLEFYNYYMENHAIGYTTEDAAYNYWYRLCEGDVEPAMEPGEIYAGRHWFYQMHQIYGKDAIEEYDYRYLYGEANGYMGQGTIRYMGEVPYFVGSQEVANISCLNTEFTIINGCLGIPIGYEGPIMVPSAEGQFAEGALTYHWESDNPDVLTCIDGFQNIFIAWEEGFANVYCTAIRNHDSGTAAQDYISIYVYDPNRMVSYGDLVDHEHTYERIERVATCEIGGAVIYTCSQPDCADSYIEAETPALGHAFTAYVSNNNATKKVNGTKTAHCDRPGCSAVDVLMEPDSMLGQLILEQTKDRGVYQVPSEEVDRVLLENASYGLVMEIDLYGGAEFKVSDLEKSVVQQENLLLFLYDDLWFSLDTEAIAYLLEQDPGETVTFQASECGKDALSEQQKQTVAASDAAMLVSVEIFGGDGQSLDLGDYEIGLHIPFRVSDGTEEAYEIYYLNQEGIALKLNRTPTVGSSYSISTDAPDTGIYLIAKNVPESLVTEPETGPELDLQTVFIAVAAVIVILLIVITLVSKKNRKKREKPAA